LVARHLDELLTDVADERLLEMVIVAEQISRGHHRPGRKLLGNVGWREVTELEIPALKRDELGALPKQRVAPIGFQIEIVLHRSSERLVTFGSKLGLRERRAESQLRLPLGMHCPRRVGSEKRDAAGGDCTTIDQPHGVFPRLAIRCLKPERALGRRLYRSRRQKCTNWFIRGQRIDLAHRLGASTWRTAFKDRPLVTA